MRFKPLCALLPSARSLRLTAYSAVAFAVLSLISERLLHAELGEAALAFGSELGGLVELTRDTETLVLDGARFHHARVVLAEPASAALDQLEHECDARPGSLALALRELAGRAGIALERYHVSAPARRGVLRYERDGRGTLVCFEAAPEIEARSLAEQVRAFSLDGDLSSFGHVRYAYVEPSSSGKIRITSIWSDDALSLSALFPASGDARGTDPHVLPRPPGMRRTLSAGAERLPLGVWLYSGTASHDAVLAFYEPWFAAHGFHRVASAVSLGASAYLRGDGLQAFVSVATEEDGHTTVSLVEAGMTDGYALARVESEE